MTSSTSYKPVLPLARVKTIMKSSPEVGVISQESLNVIGRATEMFIQYTARLAMKDRKNPSVIEYQDLAAVVNELEAMEFLRDIVPRKITGREYWEIMKEDGDNSDNSC